VKQPVGFECHNPKKGFSIFLYLMVLCYMKYIDAFVLFDF
jgi:hypothetical protein